MNLHKINDTPDDARACATRGQRINIHAAITPHLQAQEVVKFCVFIPHRYKERDALLDQNMTLEKFSRSVWDLVIQSHA